MNMLILILALIVGWCYFGDKHCPSVLKQNKQILLGVLIGLGSISCMGLGIEGFGTSFIRIQNPAGDIENYDADCCEQINGPREDITSMVCRDTHRRLFAGPDRTSVWK